MNGRSTMWCISAPDGERYDAYICGEEGFGRPALLLFSPIFGVDDDIKAFAQGWAAKGYVVAVPDYFFRVKAGVLERSAEGRKEAFARWELLDVDQAVRDMQPLVERLVSRSCCNGRWGTVGFCAGGELAFLAAVRLGAQAAAAFHGTRIHRHLGEESEFQGSLSLHYGDSDPLVPLSEVALIQQHFRNDPNVEVAIYPGANHGFSFPGRPSYNEAAATESQARVARALSALKRPPD